VPAGAWVTVGLGLEPPPELEPPEAPALDAGGEVAGKLWAGVEGCVVVVMGEDFGALKPTSWPLWL